MAHEIAEKQKLQGGYAEFLSKVAAVIIFDMLMAVLIYADIASLHGEMIELGEICYTTDLLMMAVFALGILISWAIRKAHLHHPAVATHKFKRQCLAIMAPLTFLLSSIGALTCAYSLIYLDKGICPL